MSNRLVRVEEHQWLGDTRTYLVHDQDDVCDPDVLQEIAAAESWRTFAPDTTVEARNRGFRPCPRCLANGEKTAAG